MSGTAHQLSPEQAAALDRGLLDALPGGFVYVRIDGSIAAANAEASRILGLQLDELTGRYTSEFEPETIFEDGSPCAAADYPVSRALVTGEPQPAVTIGVRRPDGRTSWALFRAHPVRSEDQEVVGAVVTFLDLTERRALEEQLRQSQRLEGLGQLAGGVAHDFNNLLQAVLTNADMGLRGMNPEAAFGAVKLAAERAADLTRQLLAFSRQQPFAPADVDLHELLGEISRLLPRLLGARLKLEIDPGAPPRVVHGDRGQLTQVLMNLALNARDAMNDEGTMQIRVSKDRPAAAPVNQDSLLDYLCVAVVDNGTGMSADVQAHVFEPFFTTKPPGSGTGLGLSVVYGIVKQHSGFVEIDSQPGRGTTFRVFLPAVEHHRTRRPAPPASIRPPGGSGERILVAEDEPMVRDAAVRLLTSAGYTVVAASDGRDALDAFGTGAEVALVLTDVVMPRLDGIELAQRLRERRPNVQVVFTTGYARPGGDALSGERVLEKPYAADDLLQMVREALDSHPSPLA